MHDSLELIRCDGCGRAVPAPEPGSPLPRRWGLQRPIIASAISTMATNDGSRRGGIGAAPVCRTSSAIPHDHRSRHICPRCLKTSPRALDTKIAADHSLGAIRRLFKRLFSKGSRTIPFPPFYKQHTTDQGRCP